MRVRNPHDGERIAFYQANRTQYVPVEQWVGVQLMPTNEDVADVGLIAVRLADGQIGLAWSIDFEWEKENA
jgi:hypothetical protein